MYSVARPNCGRLLQRIATLCGLERTVASLAFDVPWAASSSCFGQCFEHLNGSVFSQDKKNWTLEKFWASNGALLSDEKCVAIG